MFGLQHLSAGREPRHLFLSFPKLFHQAFGACLSYLRKTRIVLVFGLVGCFFFNKEIFPLKRLKVAANETPG